MNKWVTGFIFQWAAAFIGWEMWDHWLPVFSFIMISGIIGYSLAVVVNFCEKK